MATTYTPRTKLGIPAAADRGWGATIARDLEALDASALGSLAVTPKEVPSASLNVTVAAGGFRRGDGSRGTFPGILSQAVPASSTRVLYLDGSGALQLAAAYPTSLHLPLATVTTDAASVVAIVDDRILPQSVGVGAGSTLGGLAVAARENPSASLNVTVAAGVYMRSNGQAGNYAGTGSRAIAASSTRVLYLDAAGALQDAASYPTSAVVRLATVTTDAASVVAIVDDRVAIVATGDGAASLPLSGGTLDEGANVALGTATGTKLGTTTFQKLGFWGAAPIIRPAAYSQGYSAASRSLPAYVATPATSGYSGIASGQGGTPYAQASDLNALRNAVENLRGLVEGATKTLNAVIDDLQLMGLLG